MDRLETYLIDETIRYHKATYDPDSQLDEWVTKCLEELKAYRDAEEQGLLLRLPCREGAIVYQITNNTDACADCRFFDKGYCVEDYCGNKNVKDEDGHAYPSYPQYADNPLCDKHFYEIVEIKTNLDWIYHHKDEFGKTVFLDDDVAEQKLKELGENKNE